jgi:hypothetical protein
MRAKEELMLRGRVGVPGRSARAARTLVVTAVAAAGVVLAAAGLAGASAGAAAGTWGRARELPGLAALNIDGFAQINSVSCAAPGQCSAGGDYNIAQASQAFVASQVHGRWQRALQVPGSGGNAEVSSVSCGAPGECSAGGDYQHGHHQQAFVESEVHGRWQHALEVPGSAALNHGSAAVSSLSCPSAGNCSAGGYYRSGTTGRQAFVVSEVRGRWQRALEVPGTAGLNAGQGAGVSSVSCASAGNCSAGGSYTDKAGNSQAFVVSQVHGTWQAALEVPGTASLNGGGGGEADSVSCPSAGDCTAAGLYVNSAGRQFEFAVGEHGGKWGTATTIPSSGHVEDLISALSCGSPGNCSVGGFARIRGHAQAVIADEKDGVWGSLGVVPGSGALNVGGGAGVTSVSCPSAGNCAAVGSYTVRSVESSETFVVNEVHGIWGSAIELPGSAALNADKYGELDSVSCASAGNCSAGGYYTARSGDVEGLVASESARG